MLSLRGDSALTAGEPAKVCFADVSSDLTAVDSPDDFNGGSGLGGEAGYIQEFSDVGLRESTSAPLFLPYQVKHLKN